MRILIAFLLFTGTALAQAVPSWVTVGVEGGTFTVAKGTTVRFGSPISVYAAASGTHKIGDASAEAWTAPKTLDADTVFTGNTAYFGDPIYGVAKVVQVEQTFAAQSVGYAAPDGSPAIAVMIPPLTPVNQPGAAIAMDWTGVTPLPCSRTKVTAKNPDGSNGKSYYLEICGPID